MEQKQIKLLIVEDNFEMCDILENFFRMTPEIDVCATAHNGDEALQYIRTTGPDVLLLDIIMPKLDGISVLEKLNSAEMKTKPKVIVTSAVGQDAITNRALSLGASFYMIKPYNLSDLLARITLLCEAPKPRGERSETAGELWTAASRAMIEIGAPAHMRGYQYSAEALCIMLQEKRRCAIVKEIYTTVARENQTSPECVEGAIRKMIRKMCQHPSDAFVHLFSENADGPFQQPSNGKFLSSLCEKIKLGFY